MIGEPSDALTLYSKRKQNPIFGLSVKFFLLHTKTFFSFSVDLVFKIFEICPTSEKADFNFNFFSNF